MLPYGIDVILIEPGAVRTEIWDKGASQAGRYDGTDYASAAGQLPALRRRAGQERVLARGVRPSVRKVFEKKRPRTRYAIVPGRLANFTLPRLLPDRWLDRLIARNVGLTDAGRAAAGR